MLQEQDRFYNYRNKDNREQVISFAQIEKSCIIMVQDFFYGVLLKNVLQFAEAADLVSNLMRMLFLRRIEKYLVDPRIPRACNIDIQ